MVKNSKHSSYIIFTIIILLLLFSCVLLLLLSSYAESENIPLNTNDIIVTYEYFGADNNFDSEDEYDLNTVFKYRIKVINNSGYKLENVYKTVYYLENQNEPITGCLQENYVEINKNDFEYSVPIWNYFDADITEDEVFKLLENKENDVVSFQVNGERVECTGNWVDVRK